MKLAWCSVYPQRSNWRTATAPVTTLNPRSSAYYIIRKQQWEKAYPDKVTPILCIPKKNSTLRTIFDLQQQNENTWKDVTPFPDQDVIHHDIVCSNDGCMRLRAPTTGPEWNKGMDEDVITLHCLSKNAGLTSECITEVIEPFAIR